MMNYSTRQPAHSWEDTLLLFSTPSPSSLTLSSPSSFLLVFNSFSLSTTSFCLHLYLHPKNSFCFILIHLYFLFLFYFPIMLFQSYCNTWSKQDGSVNREEPKGGAVVWNGKQVTWLRHPLSPSRTHRAPLSCYTPSVVSNLLLLSLVGWPAEVDVTELITCLNEKTAQLRQQLQVTWSLHTHTLNHRRMHRNTCS